MEHNTKCLDNAEMSAFENEADWGHETWSAAKYAQLAANGRRWLAEGDVECICVSPFTCDQD